LFERREDDDEREDSELRAFSLRALVVANHPHGSVSSVPVQVKRFAFVSDRGEKLSEVLLVVMVFWIEQMANSSELWKNVRTFDARRAGE
jgi:hypothetical protein